MIFSFQIKNIQEYYFSDIYNRDNHASRYVIKFSNDIGGERMFH